MSLNGITVVETIDNVLFPFATDLLVQHPVNAIIANITNFTEVNGVNVVKVDINSASIQLYMYLATGFTLQPMSSTSQENVTINNNDVATNDVMGLFNAYVEHVVEHMFENGELNIEEDITTILYNGDGFDMLDNDGEFAEFDDFVQQNHLQLSMSTVVSS
jgi:hypothetical protein